MTDAEVEQIIKISLKVFVPQAIEMTIEQFCDDCHKRTPDCFPCRTALAILGRENLPAVVEAQAELN